MNIRSIPVRVKLSEFDVFRTKTDPMCIPDVYLTGWNDGYQQAVQDMLKKLEEMK